MIGHVIGPLLKLAQRKHLVKICLPVFVTCFRRYFVL